jgi:hypothetical protein
VTDVSDRCPCAALTQVSRPAWIADALSNLVGLIAPHARFGLLRQDVSDIVLHTKSNGAVDLTRVDVITPEGPMKLRFPNEEMASEWLMVMMR